MNTESIMDILSTSIKNDLSSKKNLIKDKKTEFRNILYDKKDIKFYEKKDTKKSEDRKTDSLDVEESNESEREEISRYLAMILEMLSRLKSENINNGSMKNNDYINDLSNLLELIEEELSQEKLDAEKVDSINNILKESREAIQDSKSIELNKLIERIKEELAVDNNKINDIRGNENIQLLTNSESDVTKEDRILNSILGEENDIKISTFSLFNERVNLHNIDVETNKTAIINKNNIAYDVIKNVKYMVDRDIKELLVKVRPKELGEMVIKIIKEDGILRANITASSKECRNLLLQNLDDIKKYLQDEDIKVYEVNIGFNSEDDDFMNQESFNNDGEKFDHKNNSQMIEEDENSDLNYSLHDTSNINMLA